MGRVFLFLFAAMASLCDHQTRAVVKVSSSSLRPQPGSSIHTDCFLTGGEAFDGWFKGQTVITNSSTAKVRVVTKNPTTYRLKFLDVKLEQAGRYECRGKLNNKATFDLDVGFQTTNVDKSQHLEVGKGGTIKLSVGGYPKPEITWQKGTTRLDPDNDRRYALLADGSLRITTVKLADQGNYTVQIQQGAYGGQVKIEVYTVELPRIKPFPAPKKYLTAGYPTVFVCKASGRPAPKYEWLNPNGDKIASFANFKISGGNLTIKKVAKELIGKYKCIAYNEIKKERIGEVNATVEIVDVYEPPTITSKGGDKELDRGALKFKLECKAKGKPLPRVVWLRNGERDHRQKTSDGQSVIEFKNIQLEDGGRYTCEARNSAVDGNGNVVVATLVRNVYVTSEPFVNKEASPNEVFSYIGNSDPAYVSCTFGGYPLPWVTMTFKKKLVSNATTTANVSVTTDALKKFGSYHCSAKNRHGTKNQTVELKEVGKPDLVRNFRATATCDSVSLTWARPLKDGGMPIIKYVLDYNGVTRNIDESDTSYTIVDLDRDREYTFVIRATNKGSWGPTVTIRMKTTKYCAPGRPIIYEPQSIGLSATSFTLKWRRPQDTGGDDDIEYIVQYRDESERVPGPWKKFRTKELEYEIKDLDKETKYKFEVIATNKGGQSSPDERFYQTSKVQARSSQSKLVVSVVVTFIAGILHLL